jgi:hypothetical protein
MGLVGLDRGLEKEESVGEVTAAESRVVAGWGLMLSGLLVVVVDEDDLFAVESPLPEDWELVRGLKPTCFIHMIADFGGVDGLEVMIWCCDGVWWCRGLMNGSSFDVERKSWWMIRVGIELVRHGRAFLFV